MSDTPTPPADSGADERYNNPDVYGWKDFWEYAKSLESEITRLKGEVTEAIKTAFVEGYGKPADGMALTRAWEKSEAKTAYDYIATPSDKGEG